MPDENRPISVLWRFIFIVLFTGIFPASATSCAYSLRLYDPVDIRIGGYTGKMVADTVFFANGGIKAVGYVAQTKAGHKTSIKVGRWKTYYENGNLRSCGNYRAYERSGCGACMPHTWYPRYKTGFWTYYYENGILKAAGTYTIKIPSADKSIAKQPDYASLVTKEWTINDGNGMTAPDRNNIIEALMWE